MLPLVIGMFGEAARSCVKLFERPLSSSPSISGSESVSTNRGKMNFFLRVREGGTRREMTGVASLVGNVLV
jgi:hypothetical protein